MLANLFKIGTRANRFEFARLIHSDIDFVRLWFRADNKSLGFSPVVLLVVFQYLLAAPVLNAAPVNRRAAGFLQSLECNGRSFAGYGFHPVRSSSGDALGVAAL